MLLIDDWQALHCLVLQCLKLAHVAAALLCSQRACCWAPGQSRQTLSCSCRHLQVPLLVAPAPHLIHPPGTLWTRAAFPGYPLSLASFRLFPSISFPHHRRPSCAASLRNDYIVACQSDCWSRDICASSTAALRSVHSFIHSLICSLILRTHSFF